MIKKIKLYFYIDRKNDMFKCEVQGRLIFLRYDNIKILEEI